MGNEIQGMADEAMNTVKDAIDVGSVWVTIANEMFMERKWPCVENLEVKVAEVSRQKKQFTIEITLKIYNPTSFSWDIALNYTLTPLYNDRKKKKNKCEEPEPAKGDLRLELRPNATSTCTTTMTVPFPDPRISGYNFKLSWTPDVGQTDNVWNLLNFNFYLPDDLLQSDSLWKVIRCYVRMLACTLSCVKYCHSTCTCGRRREGERKGQRNKVPQK